MAGRRILLVAYFYPPCRDTGALRPASMARWLRRLGHEVTVLSTSAYGPSAEPEVVQTADAQRWRARLRGTDRVDALFDGDTYGARPHPLSRVIVPEPLALAWTPFAVRRAARLARERAIEAVITTSPPESVHLVGAALQRRGVAWVADVRDAWTFEPLRPEFPTAAQRRVDVMLERRLLGAADAVVCVSEPAAADLRRRRIADPVVISNGWDPEPASPGASRAASTAGAAATAPDRGPTELLDPDRVSLVYTGRFGSYGRDPRPLVEALRRLSDADPGVAARLELVVAGPLTEAEVRLFATNVSPARIVLAGSLDRERALAVQGEADVLLLVAQPTRSQLLNIKLFEYLAAGRPILALAAGTEAGRVVAEVGGKVIAADDPEAIATALAGLVEEGLPDPAPQAVSAYTYPGPAERMATAVQQAILDRGSSPR